MARNKRIALDAVLARVQAQGADALLTCGEAAAIVAARTMRLHDTVRTAGNRVAMQMKRAAQVSDDVVAGGLARTKEGGVTADELARWASRRHPGKFDDLPTKPRNPSAGLKERFRVGVDSFSGEALPGTLEASHALIRMLRNQRDQDSLESERARAEQKRNITARFNHKKM